ncbi:ABC transporter substrate-binding protein [Ruminococcus flavefaciens]|uniref:ABC-type glycerol-3-phosphate transport system substrate-binding protein n=1 Tax=Ruminococcus flavefaciens TaxID=1265 RepID=A0A315XY79_RUMFL|nr:ABC transporter substrate-binding protein [Ruminococcus flavefaciens]PWJ12569.1 ABC-type glycerol-3-phosphate transport system substrate-binding protein [Ruminococcus flavefaciens]SSA49047.1 ABC-type glycerol-3-phosphate transport system, substrate-binding protein [Ruminococcus flavefaciens]
MKKARTFISALLLTAMSMSLLSCSSKDKSSVSGKELDSAVREEIHQNAAESDLLTGDKLENGEIKWLSDWDINPDGTGKNVPTDLAVFQERYGGTVKYYPCTYNERYDKLTEYISSDEGIDFFYGGNLDAFPRGAIKEMFVPVDDYIDFDSPLWEDVKDVNDQFIWNGKHYMAGVQATGDAVAVVYNRKTVAEAGLEDPAVLYENGEWTWDTFQEMLESYVDADNQKYGIDGWWFEFGLINTTGVPAISLENNKLVSNLSDPSMERVQNWIYDLYQKGCIAIGVGDFGWETKPAYVGEGKTLFYPIGLYDFYTEKSQWQAKYGEDAFFVPMPRDPEADEYYIPTGFESYMFVSGGSNPEGVAKYLDCKRFARLDEDTKAMADKQFMEDYGWTQEMIDMKDSMQELAEENPVIDISRGVSKDCGDLINDDLRLTARGVPWNETYDAMSAAVEKYLDKINTDPKSADIE